MTDRDELHCVISDLSDQVRDRDAELARLTAAIAERDAEIARLTAERDAAIARAERAERFIAAQGYRRCDMPACNCPYWHGGHASDRLREISDVLGDRANGVTILNAVRALVEACERGGPMDADLRRLEARLDRLAVLVKAWEVACRGDSHEAFTAARTDVIHGAASVIYAREALQRVREACEGGRDHG